MKGSGLNGIRTTDLWDAGAGALPVELSGRLGAGRYVGRL